MAQLHTRILNTAWQQQPIIACQWMLHNCSIGGQTTLLYQLQSSFMNRGSIVVDRTNQCELIHHLRHAWEEFADLNARHVGADGFERATVFRRSLRLGIPGIQMTRTTHQVDKDAIKLG